MPTKARSPGCRAVDLAGRSPDPRRARTCLRSTICVYALGGAQGYRAALVAVAAGLVGPRPGRGLAMGLGLAMARSPRLARRLDQIERTHGRASCRLGRRGRWTIIAVVVAIAALLGALEEDVGRRGLRPSPGRRRPGRDRMSRRSPQFRPRVLCPMPSR